MQLLRQKGRKRCIRGRGREGTRSAFSALAAVSPPAPLCKRTVRTTCPPRREREMGIEPQRGFAKRASGKRRARLMYSPCAFCQSVSLAIPRTCSCACGVATQRRANGRRGVCVCVWLSPVGVTGVHALELPWAASVRAWALVVVCNGPFYSRLGLTVLGPKL